jgi:hypothetical protein
MAETFYVGAYWGPRAESVDACADRLAHFLTELAQASPVLGSWFKTASSRKAALKRPVEPSAEALRELLLAGRARRDDQDRSVMSELGFAADMWNGQDVQVGFRVRCGAPVAVQGMTSNTLVMQLPAAEGGALTLYQRQVALIVLRSVVTAWQPSWCTWTSHRLRKAQEPQPGEVVAGWGTYVADRDGVLTDRLPPGVTAEHVGAGLLLTADGDADVVSETTVSAVRGALGRALRPAS